MLINKATKTHEDYNKQMGLHSSTVKAILSLKNRNNKEKSLLFYVVESERVGGTSGSMKEGRKKEDGVCAVGKEATARRFENSSNGAAPK